MKPTILHPSAFTRIAPDRIPSISVLMMMFLFFLYYYAVSPKIDGLLPKGSVKLPIPGEGANVSTGEQFDYGAWVHDLGQKLWAVPVQITEKITKAMEKK